MEETLYPQLRILHLEDSREDRDLVRSRLVREGLHCQITHVQNRTEFVEGLSQGNLDLILSDNTLPGFDGISALKIAREQRPDIPFIFVTGSMGEEAAIESIRSGATDYVLKDRLSKLSQVIKRAINEARQKDKSKRTMEALLESENRFRVFMDNSSVIAYIKDEAGRFIYVNRRFQELHRRREHEILGKTGFDLLQPEDARRIAARDAEVLRIGKPIETADNVTDSEGRVRHWLFSRFPLRDSTGRLLLGGAALEITEQLLSEGARKRSEARFSAVWKFSSDGMRLTNREGIILDVNDAYCQLVGLSAQELEGKSFTVLYPNRNKQELLRKHQERFAHEGVSFLERRVTLPSGNTIDLELTSSVIRLENEEPLMLGVFRDVTERKRAEQRIQEQAALLDKAQDAICVCTLEGRITYWNQSAERVYGWKNSEAVGGKIYELLWRDDAARFDEVHRHVWNHDEWQGELSQLTKAGKPLVVQSRWTLVKDDAGVPRSILIINTNITEKKDLEAQFLRAQRMESIGILAGGIAHDLNNVLAPIMMVSQLLRMKTDDAESLEWLDTLESSAKHGADLIKQVLAFARGVSGDRTEMQVGHLLKEIHKILRETLPRSIEIRANVPKDLWLIKGSATHLNQVLMNLCINARDAMPNGGCIEIAAENILIDENYVREHVDSKAGHHVMVRVTDTGTGIPPEVLARIYEPFFTTKKVGQGTGLGLSTVQNIVKTHEGFIQVVSEIGKGTTFKVFFPAALSGELRETELQRAFLPRGLGECILVVDDEESVRGLLQATLEKYNYKVITATNGETGLAAYGQSRNDIKLVLTDLNMPKMEGRALIAALRRIDPQLKIIALSGMIDPGLRETPELNAVELMQKPFSNENLLTTISRTLRG